MTDQSSSFPPGGAQQGSAQPTSDQPPFDQPAPGEPMSERLPFEQPAPGEQPYYVPTEHQQAWSAAQHYYGARAQSADGAPGAPFGPWQPPPAGYQQAGYQSAGYQPGYQQPGYQAGYPYLGHAGGYWAPPPAQPRKHPHRLLYGSVAAAVAAALTVGGVALAFDQNGSSSRQTSLSAPNPANPFDPNAGGNGGFGFGFGDQGPGGNGDQGNGNQGGGNQGGGNQGGGNHATGTATAAQSVGVVDVNTTVDYGRGRAAGTGIVLSPNGEILTNNHVVQDSTAISVTVVSTGKTYTATVVGTDPTDDVAVIQLQNASGLATAKLGDSGAVKVGDAVTAVGNAGGTGGTPSSASGSVTGLGQSITASDENGANPERLTGLIQVDADIQAGDSGGPLYDDATGSVVGMDTAASSSGARLQSGSTTGFAIPIAKATSIAQQIEGGTDNATIHQGYPAFLGVQLSRAGQGQGAAVAGVVPNSGAAKAGLAAGDVITSVDGAPVADATALSSLLAKHNPGDRVRIGYTDGAGQSHPVTVTLGQGPAD